MSSLLISLLSLVSLLLADDKAEILFAGDAMMHQSQLDAARRTDGTYDFSQYFTAIQPYIASADLAVVNLETPLGGAPYSGYPMFGAPDSYLDALQQAGFDFILLANNHMLDRRDRGLRRTIDTVESRRLPFAGVYRSQAHRDSIVPAIYDAGGFRIAILNYTYGTNGIRIQGDVKVDYIDEQLIESDIMRAREAGAELIAVCLHWGEEYHLLPTASQRSLTSRLKELGADMIIGGHPHVIEPMEFDSATGRFNEYSLGNFISGMRTTDTRGGAMARVYLSRDTLGEARIDSVRYRLVFTVPPGVDSISNYHLIPAENHLKGIWENNRRAFVGSAERIFRTHNINVTRDSSAIIPRQQ